MSDRLLVGIGLLGLLLSGLALLRVELAQRRRRELALQRFREIVGIEPGRGQGASRRLQLVRRLRRHFWAAGIELTERHLWIWGPGLAVLALLAWVVAGLLAAVILVLLALGGLQLLLGLRTARRRRLMLEQLPAFLEHVVRMISAGTSLAVAIQEASRDTPDPLGHLLAQLERQLQLGAALDDALDRVTEGLGLRELDMVALALRVHQRYGGSVVDLLRGVTRAVRDRDRMQREFHAMTAETRTSALILGSMPLALAVYVMLFNPAYLGSMWNDPAGRGLLLAAAGLQLVGSWLLWRMVRSV